MTPLPALNPESDALFLDFDGTLAPIVARPADAALRPCTRTLLRALRRRSGGALAIISGRPVCDLDARVPRSVWRVGGHGAEMAAPHRRAEVFASQPDKVAALVDQLAALTAPLEGVTLEPKRTGAALHFRANPAMEAACLQALEEALRPLDGFRIQSGHCVLEAVPANASKAAALFRLMRHAPFAGRRPVMVGDDVTDEGAMEAALSLRGLALKVGAGDSCAPWRLAGPDQVHDWLAGALTQTGRGGTGV